jgi:diacylglycerol kinase family enzyme
MEANLSFPSCSLWLNFALRAAAIFGLSSSTKDLKPFQNDPHTMWLIGSPSNSNEADVVLIFGGDGTIHRHLPHLVKLQLPVLVVPRGSGNDFARAVKLRSVRDSVTAWRRFLSGKNNVRMIDLGVITPLLPQGLKPEDASPHGTAEAVPFPSVTSPTVVPSPNSGNWKQETRSSHYFCCVAGVGLDGEIARRADGLPRWLRAHGGYILSSVPSLFQFAAVPMRILLPQKDRSAAIVRSERPTILATFANTPTFGGGMRIAPRAQFDDGLLDICVVSDLNKFKRFWLFPTVYFGRHLTIPEVEYFQSDGLRLETESPLHVYADGEYVCQTPVEVTVAPRVLSVIVHPSQTGF